jgi:hypothetical protein
MMKFLLAVGGVALVTMIISRNLGRIIDFFDRWLGPTILPANRIVITRVVPHNPGAAAPMKLSDE